MSVTALQLSSSAFKDNNADCVLNTGDIGIIHIPLKLYDASSNLISQTYSFASGTYQFIEPAGTYTVQVDTAGLPFISQCIYPGVDSTVTLSAVDSIATGVNFDISCNGTFDLGTQSVITNGWVFPGQLHTIRVLAGDMSQWYNLYCSSGISGQVVVTVSGNVSYVAPALGALTPSVSGNVFTYTIADFGTVNMLSDFGLKFLTNITAVAGDTVCVNVVVSPTAGDNNTANNIYDYCYLVVASMDPNFKEVYPVDVEVPFQDWLTYTIHFQNTGTAPAFNIRLTDTLDANLDLETFSLINFSHYSTTSLKGNVLTVHFPNIMLPDSSVSQDSSQGFVQYRIKPKANLPLGTEIKNTAYIYFDFNAPVVTNTTINEFVGPSGIHAAVGNRQTPITVFPNPFKSTINVFYDGQFVFELFDVSGRIVFSQELKTAICKLEASSLSSGIYLWKATTKKGEIIGRGKLVKE